MIDGFARWGLSLLMIVCVVFLDAREPGTWMLFAFCAVGLICVAIDGR